MQRLNLILRNKLRSRSLRRSDRAATADLWGMLLPVLLGTGFLAFFLFYVRVTQGLPSLVEFENRINARPQPSFFTDATGETRLLTIRFPDLDESSAPRYPALSDYAPEFIRAMVAAEDSTFFTDNGSLFGVAAPLDPTPQRISEKLAEILFPERLGAGLTRAFRIRILGSQILRFYPREKILIAYLENAYFGQYAIGVRAALRTYLDRTIRDASLADGVLLSAILEKPALNPIDSQGAMRTSYLAQIDRLLSAQHITSSEADSLRAQSFLIFEPLPLERTMPTNPVLEKAVLAAIGKFGSEAIERGNVAVRTTIDAELQSYLNCLSGIVPDSGVLSSAETSPNETAADAETDGEADDPTQDEIASESEQNDITVASACPLETAASDEIEARAKRLLAATELSVFVLDAKTGDALAALQTGNDRLGNRISEKTFHAYAPGSLLTFFTALTAYENGWSPATGVFDMPSFSKEPLPAAYLAEEPDELGPIRLRTALTKDRLAPILDVTRELGSEKILRTLDEFGLSNWSGLSADRLYFDGGYVTAEALAIAFSTFAGSGQINGVYLNERDTLPRPRTVREAYTPSSPDPIELQPRGAIQLVDESLAYLVNHTFSAETEIYRTLNRPAVVKTGKSLSETSRWLVGYTPDRVIVLRIGAVLNAEAPDEDRIEEAARLFFQGIADRTLRNTAPTGWTEPEMITRQLVCAESGKLPTSACPNLVTEVFIAGNEPTERDTLYQSAAINSENQTLATSLTPLRLREMKTFLNLTGDEKTWAERKRMGHESRYDAIPSVYDTVLQRETGAVQIFSPVSFTEVSLNMTPGTEKVEIKVALNLDRPITEVLVKIGDGIDPTRWREVNSIQKIENGRWTVAEINPTDLTPGIHVVRVAAIDADGRYIYDDAVMLKADTP